MGDLPSTLGILLSGLLDAEGKPAAAEPAGTRCDSEPEGGKGRDTRRSDADARPRAGSDAAARVTH